MIQSITRAADILNVFLGGEKTYGITELSRILCLPKGTVQGLVKTLEVVGYLEKAPGTSRYMLGPVLFQLGMKCASHMDILAVSKVWMEKLWWQFRQAVLVGILVGGRVVVIHRLDSQEAFLDFPQVGSAIPTHSSSLGKALLAFLPEALRDSLLEGYTYERFTEFTLTSREDFLAELEAVRTAGVAFDNQESLLGLACVSAPIFNNRGRVIAAVSLSGDAQVMKERHPEIVRALREACRQISLQLGHVEHGPAPFR